MNILLTVALIVTALLIDAYFATDGQSNFQRSVGVTQYHNARHREPL